MFLQEVLTEVKVTAVKWIKEGDLLLAGTGGNLKAYKGKEKFLDERLFTGSVIHGIREETNGEIVVFGGKEWIRAKIEMGKERIFSVERKGRCQDWILDIRMGDEGMEILTAHNRVVREGKEDKVCKEKCILYSGTLFYCDKCHRRTVLAGTVFQEVIIWPLLDDDSVTEGEDHPVAQRISGHEGVVFSVDYNESNGLVCSTSDDRSARLWKVHFEEGQCCSWETASVETFMVIRGHSARVFRCKLLEDMVIVGGEDSEINVWSVKSKERLKQISQAHQGSPVWSIDANENFVFSGGGDGSLRMWEINSKEVIVPEEAPHPYEIEDYPRIVTAFEDSFLVLSDLGSLYHFDSGLRKPRLLLTEENAAKYALMEVADDKLILATLHGKVLVYDIRKCHDTEIPEVSLNNVLEVFENFKIFSLHPLSQSHFLVCGPEGRMKVVDLSWETRTLDLILPECGTQRWTSAAVGHLDGQFLAVGDRHGGLHLYDDQTGDLLHSIKRAHGRHGIGNMRAIGKTSVTTAGRDGTIKQFEVSRNGLEERSSTKMPFDWLEEISRDRRLVVGFHSTDFVVYSAEECRNLVRVPCGGGHRSWTLNKGHGELCFIKDKKLYAANLNSISSLERCTLKKPLHARTISVVHFFTLASRNFIITAGEDVVIKIHEVEMSDGEVVRTQKVSLKSHISSVKTVKTVCESNTSCLMASGGGRAQIKVWRICLYGEDILATELSSHMLKGNDKRRKKTWRDSDVIHDTETRFMDLEFLGDSSQQLRIVTCCSDGFLRLMSVSEDLKRISLLSETGYIGRCYLRVTRAYPSSAFYTTSTDGILRVWQLEKNSEIKAVETVSGVNQSGSNALYVDKEIILTGGDDGAISAIDAKSRTILWTVNGAHSAQVAAIHSLEDVVISWSVDQRLNVWKMHCKGLCLESQSYSDVDGASSMAAWKDKNGAFTTIAIGGEGLALFQISK